MIRVMWYTNKPVFNTLRPRQHGRYFPDDILKCIFLKENVWIPIKISLKFVWKSPINNIPALVQIMAWRRPGDKPLSEPMTGCPVVREKLKGNSRLGKSQGKIREFCWRSGKKWILGKVREFAFSAIYVVKNNKKSQNSLSLQSIQFWRLSLCTILWKFKASNFVFW